MKTIVIASRKGGVGKTTICGHLAALATVQGCKVCVIDTDPQGSLKEWWEARQKQDIEYLEVSIDKLSASLQMLAKAKFDYVLIDTPPSVSGTIEKVITHADLVIIPTRPSPHDLRALGGTVDIVNELGKKMIFVINGAANRARITTEAVVALSQHGPVCPAVLFQRTDFATSMLDGKTVSEISSASKSALEVEELLKYVNTHLNKKAKK